MARKLPRGFEFKGFEENPRIAREVAADFERGGYDAKIVPARGVLGIAIRKKGWK